MQYSVSHKRFTLLSKLQLAFPTRKIPKAILYFKLRFQCWICQTGRLRFPLQSACSFILGAAFPVRLSKVRGSMVCNSPINTYTTSSSITVCYSSENVTTAAFPAASTVPSGPGGAAGSPSFLMVTEAEAMTAQARALYLFSLLKLGTLAPQRLRSGSTP